MTSFSVWPTLLWQLELHEFLEDALPRAGLPPQPALHPAGPGVLFPRAPVGFRTCAVCVPVNCHWRTSAPGEGAQDALSKPGLETLPTCAPPSQIRFCGAAFLSARGLCAETHWRPSTADGVLKDWLSFYCVARGSTGGGFSFSFASPFFLR